MNAKIQNYIFEQYGGDESKRITCVLTRFVSFKIEMNGYTLEENERRERSCTPNFAGEEIRKAIGIYMGAKAKEADIPVSADEQSRIDADASDSSSN